MTGMRNLECRTWEDEVVWVWRGGGEQSGRVHIHTPPPQHTHTQTLMQEGYGWSSKRAGNEMA